MVKAFFIHTLLPGRCTVLYSRWYGPAVSGLGAAPELLALKYTSSTTPDTISLSSQLTVDPERVSLASNVPISEDLSSVVIGELSSAVLPAHKQQALNLCKEVQSQYSFKSALSGKSYDRDLQRLNTEGTIPDLEQGYFRHRFDEPEDDDNHCDNHSDDVRVVDDEKVVLWMGALNTGFCLVCHKNENRILAEKLLRFLVRSLQEHCRAMNHPTEIVAKPDRITTVLDQILPSGTLLFSTHRVTRQFEKELEKKLKTT